MNASLLLFVQLADRTLDCNRDSYSSLKLFWTTRLASGFLYTNNSSQAMWRLRRAGASGVTRTPDLLITNQLLYRLSYTSISIFDSDHNTIFLSQRQHPFQFSPSMRLSCFCILLYVLLQVFLQNKCCHFFILHFRVIVNCGKIEKICRCISAILS